MFEGRFCRGETDEYTESCNNGTCPTVSPESLIPGYLKNATIQYLNSTWHHYDKVEGDVVAMNCANNITTMFFREFPDASLKFIRNAASFPLNPKRMQLLSYGILSIAKLEASDTGLYLCQVEFVAPYVQTVDVYSLIVRSNEPQIKIRATQDLKLVCNSAALGLLFTDCNQKWFLNDEVYRDYGFTPPSSINIQTIEGASMDLAGTWTCSISHVPTNRTWITNLVKVAISPPPSPFENPVIMGCVVGGAFGIVAILVFAFAYRGHQAEQGGKELFEMYMEGRGSDGEEEEDDDDVDKPGDTSGSKKNIEKESKNEERDDEIEFDEHKTLIGTNSLQSLRSDGVQSKISLQSELNLNMIGGPARKISKTSSVENEEETPLL